MGKEGGSDEARESKFAFLFSSFILGRDDVLEFDIGR